MPPDLNLLEEDGRRSFDGVAASTLANKTVMIAGASGIIGSHFLFGLRHCQEELALPLKVIALMQSGVPSHLGSLVENGDITALIGDLTDPQFLKELPTADVIVHAATYGQPGRFMTEAESTLKLNTTSTFGLLDKLLPGGRFLFVSSSEVYSGLADPPYSEHQIGTTNTTHPRSCYIEAKRCGEAICIARRNLGVAVKCARLSLAYGPGTRQGDKRVLYSLIEKALRDGSITLLDQGTARRTYCYVSDAVHMLWQILLGGQDSIYNVGGVSSTTIADLAQLIGKMLHVPVRFPPGSAEGLQAAPDDVRLNLAKFESEFGPMRFRDLTEGLARTIEWQASLYSDGKGSTV